MLNMSMANREESYYLVFKTIGSLEEVFDFVQEQTTMWTEEIEMFRDRIEVMADAMVQMAVDRDWTYAFQNSGFQDLWAEYEDFAETCLRPLFEA